MQKSSKFNCSTGTSIVFTKLFSTQMVCKTQIIEILSRVVLNIIVLSPQKKYCESETVYPRKPQKLVPNE